MFRLNQDDGRRAAACGATRTGFTLVELVVVLLVLGILAGVATPRLLEVSRDAEAAAVLTNVNRIFDAAERFHAKHGRLPTNSNRRKVPAELAPDYLPADLFTTDTSLGSPLDWNGPGTGLPVYGVSITLRPSAPAAKSELYRTFERLADDGDPGAGWIQADGHDVLFRLSDVN